MGDYALTITLEEGAKNYQYEFTVEKEDASDLTFKFQMGYDQWSNEYYNRAYLNDGV